MSISRDAPKASIAYRIFNLEAAMQTIRRVVTGNNLYGKSYVVSDEQIPSGILWQSNYADSKGSSAGGKSVGSSAKQLPTTAGHIEPPPGGHYLFYGSFAPWSTEKLGFDRGQTAGFDDNGFHRTATTDYLFIMQGEVELLLDEESVHIGAGDVVVQRNTHHAWHNNTDGLVVYLAVTVKLPDPATAE